MKRQFLECVPDHIHLLPSEQGIEVLAMLCENLTSRQQNKMRFNVRGIQRMLFNSGDDRHGKA